MIPVQGGLVLAQLIRHAITQDKELEKAQLEAHMLQIKANTAQSMFETWTTFQSELANSKIEHYSKHLQWVLSSLAKDREDLQEEKKKLTEEQFSSDTDDLRLAYITKRVSEIQVTLNKIRLEEQLCTQQTNVSIAQVNVTVSDIPRLM